MGQFIQSNLWLSSKLIHKFMSHYCFEKKKRPQVEAQINKSELLNCLHQLRVRYSKETGISRFTISFWTFSGKKNNNKKSCFSIYCKALMQNQGKSTLTEYLSFSFSEDPPAAECLWWQQLSLLHQQGLGHFQILQEKALHHRGIQLFTTQLRVMYSTFAQTSCTSSIF